MISAIEALNLPNAQISDDDIALYKAATVEIDKHLRAKMLFSGPEVLELSEKQLSFTAAKIVAVMAKRFGWNMNLQFGVKQTNFGKSAVWQLTFSPTIEVYEQVLADFDISAPTNQLLV